MRLTITFILLIIYSFSYAQTKKEIAKNKIINLKENSALIVRVHLNKKNISLYRNAGYKNLANKLENELNINSYLIHTAFLDTTYFNFCPVYIIDAKDYIRVNNGEKSGYFLDGNMNIDPSISLKEENYFFVDRGNSFKTEESSYLELSDAFVVKDKDLNLLKKPFPFFKIINGRDIFSTIWYSFSTRIKYRRSISDVKHKSDKKNAVYSEINSLNSKEKLNQQKVLNYLTVVYGLEHTEKRIPFNIFKFNYKLEKFYKKKIN